MIQEDYRGTEHSILQNITTKNNTQVSPREYLQITDRSRMVGKITKQHKKLIMYKLFYSIFRHERRAAKNALAAGLMR